MDASVLRRRLRALAEATGAPLVEGRGASLRLSPAGAKTAAAARRVEREIASLFDDVAAAPHALDFAGTGTITNHVLPGVIAELREREPDLVVRVRRAGAEKARALLKSGDVHLAVLRAERAPRDLAARRLASDRLWLALPASHPLLCARSVSLDDLAALPLVTFGESSSTRRRVLASLSPRGVEPSVEVDGRAAALRYVGHGLGAAYLSLSPSDRIDERGIGARDVTRLFPRSSFFVVHDPARTLTPLEALAVRLLEQRTRARGR